MPTQPIITAVGRLLQPKHGEPQVHSVITIGADGQARETTRRILRRDRRGRFQAKPAPSPANDQQALARWIRERDA